MRRHSDRSPARPGPSDDERFHSLAWDWLGVFPRDFCARSVRVSIEDHATALRTLGKRSTWTITALHSSASPTSVTPGSGWCAELWRSVVSPQQLQLTAARKPSQTPDPDL